MIVSRDRRQPRLGRRWRRVAGILIGALIGLSLLVPVMRANHQGTNLLRFAAVEGSPSPAATGAGQIEYHGGAEPESRWTSTFEFVDLEPEAPYVVVVQGRTGDDGSAAAQAFSPICDFISDATGAGHCWDYELGLRRLAVVQLRRDDAAGPVVLQAARVVNEVGAIVSNPNDFSPETGTPHAVPSR